MGESKFPDGRLTEAQAAERIQFREREDAASARLGIEARGYKVSEVAAMLGVPASDIWLWCRNRLIIHYRISKTMVRLRAEQIEELTPARIAELKATCTHQFRNMHEVIRLADTMRTGKMTNVYFMRCGNTVKVGYAAAVQARLKDLRGANPRGVDLIGYVHADSGLEKAIHKKFSRIRVQGEWFKATPGLLAFIDHMLKHYEARENG